MPKEANMNCFTFYEALFASLLIIVPPDTAPAREEGGGRSHLADLAIDTYTPPANALGLAQARAQEYWAKHREEVGRGARYLAVQSYPIFSEEIPQLYSKMLRSPRVSSWDLENKKDNKGLNMQCVSVFDTETQTLVSPLGYAVVDLPTRGSMAQFGIYQARYIGRGG